MGKTNAKLSLWRQGRLQAAASRANTDIDVGAYRALDAEGVLAWVKATLRSFANEGDIDAIVPVAHGAAAAIVRDGELVGAPMSYECELDASPEYARLRDSFADTGSPRLPNGLNLGAQLHQLETLTPGLLEDGAQIMPYPQYWAWVLAGVTASEVSSLGCHTDLWRPREGRFSDLAVQRGWAAKVAPMRSASEVLGGLNASWARDTGINNHCDIYCGGHDSNVALYGVRSHPILSGRDVTVISTGTWFVAMRVPLDAMIGDLDERRDTLINVGVDGALIPSARFMGGRELDMLIGAEDSPMRTPHFVREIAPLHVGEVISRGSMIAPSFAAGVGPFPNRVGGWMGEALTGPAGRAAAGLYLALMADQSLRLIGACDAVVIEGRFADDVSFLRMLAALRPDCDIYALRSDEGLALGALRLTNPGIRSNAALSRVEPLDVAIEAYAQNWRAAAQEEACA